jgi:alkylation response protein AidB-like acyl-CoA dehydrogenase
MDFSRAEQIAAIRDSAAAVVPPGAGLGRVRALRFTPPGFDRAVLRTMGEMGWLGLAVPEDAGGAGLGLAELCALAEALGRGCVPEPFVATAALALPLLAEVKQPDLAAALSGEQLVLAAWQEKPNTLEAGSITTQAEGNQLTGQKRFVPCAAGADAFLVSARLGVKVGLFLVQAADAQVKTDGTMDGGGFGTLELSATPAVPLLDDAAAPLTRAIDRAALATAAELLGVAEAAFAMTLDYLKTRTQFGRAIGSFQALQHRAADLRIQLALTRASIDAAVAAIEGGAQGARRAAAVSQAKARASDAGLLVTRQAIQLHGGIGYTDEHDIGLYLKRAMVLSALYGNAALHRARFAATARPEDDAA